jgi:hypothetical protein
MIGGIICGILGVLLKNAFPEKMHMEKIHMIQVKPEAATLA